jgi:hypothetical protein
LFSLKFQQQKRNELFSNNGLIVAGDNEENVLTWTCSDVGHWLERLGCPQFRDSFSSNLVDGKMLLTLTESDLETHLGVTNKLHQRRLLFEIANLKNIVQGSDSTSLPLSIKSTTVASTSSPPQAPSHQVLENFVIDMFHCSVY